MEDKTKPWYASKGVMGPAVSLVVAILGFFGYTMSEVDAQALITVLVTAATVAGSVTGIVGRVKATKKIGKVE